MSSRKERVGDELTNCLLSCLPPHTKHHQEKKQLYEIWEKTLKLVIWWRKELRKVTLRLIMMLAESRRSSQWFILSIQDFLILNTGGLMSVVQSLLQCGMWTFQRKRQSLTLPSVTHHDQISGWGVPGWALVRIPWQILTRPMLHAFRINPVTDMHNVKILSEGALTSVCDKDSLFPDLKFQQQQSASQLCSRVRGSNFQGSPFSKLSANY